MAKLLSYIPYELLIETDGGPDHAISTFQNKFAILALFLFTSVGRIIFIRGCPGIFCLSILERKMPVLNISLSNLAFQIKPCQWLLDEVLANNFLMKQVRIAVSEYDNELPMVIDVSWRRDRTIEEE